MSQTTSPLTHYLESIIHPKSIAVIGASKSPEKRGYRAIASLLADKYQGTIYPINPKETEILGLKCYPTISNTPEPVDLALVCTAANTVPGVIELCGQAGVKGAVLLAGGFSEASEAGRLLEEQTLDIAEEYKLRMIGPNTNGMFSARRGCNALGTLNIPRGNIAVLSNSANIMSSLLNEMIVQGHSGISVMLSVGNQTDIFFDEYLDFLGTDKETHAIIFYVEGFKNAHAFLHSVRAVSPIKPIVMYVAGRNSAGVRAAKSHSGSLAGDYAISKNVLKQAGAIVVSRSDDLFAVSEALSLLPPMKGRRVAILSEGGGPITVASEACADQGLELATLSQETQEKIKKIVPNATAISNPVDAGGGTDPRPEYYESISDAILQDPNIDGLLLVGLFGGYGVRWGEEAGIVEEQVCLRLAEMSQQYGKPIMVQSHFAHMNTHSLTVLRKKGGIPYQRHIETAVQCLASLADYNEAKQRLQKPKPIKSEPKAKATEILKHAQNLSRDLLETEALDVLKAYGVSIDPYLFITDKQQAHTVEQTFGNTPLAVKIVSKDIQHKSDVGGVKLNIAGAAATEQAITSIQEAIKQSVPSAEIQGYLLRPMAPRGTELLVGILQDPTYGRVLAFGLGGVFVEVMRDVSFRALPITEADAWEMIAELKHADVLNGVRGNPPVDKPSIVQLLLDISNIAYLHPEIKEIDLNPIIAHQNGLSIVDARIILSAE
jgi:acyl-CoA synthetase (NDP forming)